MLNRRRGMLYVTGALLLGAPPALWLISSYPAQPLELTSPVRGVELASHTVNAAALPADPADLLRRGLARYESQVHSYRCVLVKQERLGDELTPVQEVEVRFRESPRATYMLWRKNADQAKRALYIDDPSLVDKKGHRTARVEPAGAIARLFVSDLYVAIDGPEAKKSSRRAINECGFRATFEMFERYNAIAAEHGVLDLRYAGEGEIDGRPTYIITRDLPYDPRDALYPDARLVMHVDQAWLLPVAIFSYADHAQTKLLGSYVFKSVELNPAFTADAFDF
jgi:hypothetical protein